MTQAPILVDIQNDCFPGGAMELVGMNAATKNAPTVLDVFREHSEPIFNI
jgi:nicotinamidase-related amidase